MRWTSAALSRRCWVLNALLNRVQLDILLNVAFGVAYTFWREEPLQSEQLENVIAGIVNTDGNKRPPCELSCPPFNAGELVDSRTDGMRPGS